MLTELFSMASSAYFLTPAPPPKKTALSFIQAQKTFQGIFFLSNLYPVLLVYLLISPLIVDKSIVRSNNRSIKTNISMITINTCRM